MYASCSARFPTNPANVMDILLSGTCLLDPPPYMALPNPRHLYMPGTTSQDADLKQIYPRTVHVRDSPQPHSPRAQSPRGPIPNGAVVKGLHAYFIFSLGDLVSFARQFFYEWFSFKLFLFSQFTCIFLNIKL